MEEQELQLPREFKTCPNPNCGSDRRIAEMTIEKQKAKGRFSQQAQGHAFQLMTQLIDPTKPSIMVPTVLAKFDVCVDCGTFYCVWMDVAETQPLSPGSFSKPKLGPIHPS